jgi:hypothetical protein
MAERAELGRLQGPLRSPRLHRHASWPLDDRSPAELRASPNPALARIGINGIINHYDRLIRALPEARLGRIGFDEWIRRSPPAP